MNYQLSQNGTVIATFNGISKDGELIAKIIGELQENCTMLPLGQDNLERPQWACVNHQNDTIAILTQV
jgi:hypothetical protein